MEMIKRLLRCLQTEYLVFWLLVLLLVFLYELEVLPQGILVNDPKTAYMVQVLGILLAVGMIPFSLRLFSLSLTRYVRQKNLKDALVSYRRWSEVRLALLIAPALINLAVYYWTFETKGLLCAGMALLASLFCVPGEKRLKTELDLDSNSVNEEDV